ncbi:VOC family protein [Luteococcus sp. OSA5]|uniref:VOC family protein n=1 Tax=Luteococcus sp. OSA5 TaxID=3401630 RepID=UPI003B429754
MVVIGQPPLEDMMNRATGTPAWLDLGTTDLEGVKPFYQELFGWQFEDCGPAMSHYNMITKDGGLVGGAMDMTQCNDENDAEPRNAWDVFLAVDDVDGKLQLALDNAANLVAPAMDAGPAGRFAIVADPAGAVVAMWQAKDTEGYAFTGRPGTPIWFELVTTDLAGAIAFYTTVFDFSTAPMDDDYATNGPVEEATSGMMRSEDDTSHWQVTFAVADIEAALVRTIELGGQVVTPSVDSPWGPYATIADPTGARLLVMQASPA